ncbi:MAG TPA: prepilin peptidase [Xanthobacteraceae bacterium]|nr:prepilin peptidase [Xanthobacteraceae bacterium]
MLTELIRLTLFPGMMAFAASSDLFTMTIANRVSLILVGGFVILALLTGMSAADMLVHAGAAAAVLVVTFMFFACGWIGGGDAKLAAATVLWLGVGHLADYAIYASLLGGALTLLMVQYRAMPMPAFLAGREWAERLHRSDTGVPYGIALAAAALLVYPQTEWMTALSV